MIPCSCSAHHTLCPCLPCIIRALAQQVADELPNATDRLESAFKASRPTDGLRSASFDGSNRHGTGGHSDPVLDTVEAHDTRTRLTVHKVREFQQDCLGALRKALDTMDDGDRYQYLRDARADLIEAQGILMRVREPKDEPKPIGGDKGCQSCRRINGPSGTPWWNPTEKGERGHRALCHVCRDWTAKRRKVWELAHPGQPASDPTRFWPPKGAVEKYRDTGKMQATDQQWDAWDAADRKAKKGRKAS